MRLDTLQPALVLALAIAGGSARAAQEPAKSSAPDATFTSPDGKVVHLADYRGKQSVVLLLQRGYADGYACFFCATQTREYKEAYAKLRAAGAEVLIVLPGTRDAEGYLRTVGQMDEEHPDPKFSVPFPVLGDPDFSACRTFEVPHVDDLHGFPVSQPATFVISKEGAVLFAYHGKDPSDRPPLDTVLGVVRSGRPVESGV